MKAVIELYKNRENGEIKEGVVFEIPKDISTNKTNQEIMEYLVKWRKEKNWVPNIGRLKVIQDIHGEYELKGGILEEEGYIELYKEIKEELNYLHRCHPNGI